MGRDENTTMEKKFVEQELSQLLEATLRWEDELNAITQSE
jgi:hypothetical protein